MEFFLKPRREWVRASERAPRNSQRILERLHALAELVEGGGGVLISLLKSQRYAEAMALLRNMTSVARRALGEDHELTLKMRKMYAASLCVNPDATLDDTREAVTTLEEIELIARRVLGGAHPLTKRIEGGLREAQAALRARDTPSTSG